MPFRPDTRITPRLATLLTVLAALLSGCNPDAPETDTGQYPGPEESHFEQSASNSQVSANPRTVRQARNARTWEAPASRLIWRAPLTREDGRSLYPGEISGYRIYYKLAHQEHFRTIPVDNPSDTALPLDGFSPGVYQFAISVVDINGFESRRSATIRINIT